MIFPGCTDGIEVDFDANGGLYLEQSAMSTTTCWQGTVGLRPACISNALGNDRK